MRMGPAPERVAVGIGIGSEVDGRLIHYGPRRKTMGGPSTWVRQVRSTQYRAYPVVGARPRLRVVQVQVLSGMV